MFDDLIGKCFASGGRGPDSYDCWGLAMEVLSRYGVNVPDYNIAAFACRDISHAVEVNSQSPSWESKTFAAARQLVVIKNHPKYVNHVGVCIGAGKFIHVMQTINVTVDNLNSPLWRKRIRGFYRYAG